MVNTPIPHNLGSEAKKAAKILREFSIPNAKTGPDGLIPAGILATASGLAILTVFKAGFLVTARGGSGIVIARLSDDEGGFAKGWSAPSAIGLAGLGGGFEIGMEVTDFVIILNTQSAVDAFSKGGNLTLGGNFTIAAGPLGRNLEGDIAVRSPAAIYTYSKTKGIFAGISIEGSALIERKDANRKFYGRDIRAHQILNGEVDPPEECRGLYAVLKEHREFAEHAMEEAGKKQAQKQKEKLENMSEYSRFKFTRSKSVKSNHSSDSQPDKSERKDSESASSSSSSSTQRKRSLADVRGSTQASKFSSSTPGDSAPSLQTRKNSAPAYDPWKEIDQPTLKGATAASAAPSYDRKPSPELWAVAEFTYQGLLRCDLSFRAGELIKVTTRTKSQHDWWEGVDSAGHSGIFPANYVHVVS